MIEKETSVDEVVKYLIDEAIGIGYEPDLILSIIGETKHYKIDEKIKNIFKKSLIKSRSLDTWIMTGGANSGIDYLVGNAIDEDLNSNFLPLYGISSLECLAIKDELKHMPSEEVK